MTPQTTPALQAKVELRRAWFEAHPNQPIPEGRAQVEALFAAIETEAAEAAGAALAALSPESLHRIIVAVDTRGCGGTHLMGYGYCQLLSAQLIDGLSGAAPAAPAAPALDTERRAVVAAAAIFLAAHYRVIAANPVTRDDTFAMKNAADTLRDALREYARLANPLKP